MQLLRHYNLPDFGEVVFELYEKSILLYEQFERNQVFKSLSAINNIGILSTILKSAKYTREDYIHLQLFILTQLHKRKISNIGLGRTLRIGNMKMSNAELIQMWMLLFNYGHFMGTFEAERALFSFIRSDRRTEKSFWAAIRPHSFRSKAKDIFAREYFHQFHYVFLSFLLNDQKLFGANKRTYMACLSAYLADNRETVRRSKRIFGLVRKLAYTYMDLHATNLFIELDLKKFIINPGIIITYFDHSGDRKLDSTLNSIRNLLDEYIYFNPKYSPFYHQYEKYLRDSHLPKLYKQKVKAGQKRIFNSICKEMRGNYPLPPKDTVAPKFLFRIHVNERNFRDFRPDHIMSFADSLRSRFSNCNCDCYVSKSPARRDVSVDFLSTNAIRQKEKIAFTGRVIEIIVEAMTSADVFWEDLQKHYPWMKELSGQPGTYFRVLNDFRNLFTELFSGLFRLFCSSGFRLMPIVDRDWVLPDYYLFRHKKDVAIFMDAYQRVRNDLDRFRANEIDTLIRAVRQDNEYPCLVPLQQHNLVNSDDKIIHEIDGCYFSFSRNGIALSIIEAKSQATGFYRTSRDQLAQVRSELRMDQSKGSRKTIRKIPKAKGCRLRIEL